MFNLQLWDLSVGFIAALVLVNFIPRLALFGGWIIKIAKAGYSLIKSKVTK